MGADPLPDATPPWEARFAALFDAHFRRLVRFLDRLSGEPDLAADLAQEAFVKLYERGAAPDRPEAWLVTVAMNLYRNARATRSRRLRLLAPIRGEEARADPPPSTATVAREEASRRRVRGALDGLPERERRMLLLRAEGFRYREIAEALGLNEASVGVLLARARRAFRKRYEEGPDAS